MTRLSDAEIHDALEELSGWTHLGGAIHKEFRFRGFRAAIAFINRVAEQAIAAAHHPDIESHTERVIVSLTTHDAGGVTSKDVDLARAIERVADPTDA
jgi:4a-hydroxytetrahydrobiopterin dehydratase